jgi:prepilin-type N-terminal cleavage/methylation domain-containing protein
MTGKMTPRLPFATRAFSLLEVLVAMAVLSLVLVLLLSVTNNA